MDVQSIPFDRIDDERRRHVVLVGDAERLFWHVDNAYGFSQCELSTLQLVALKGGAAPDLEQGWDVVTGKVGHNLVQSFVGPRRQ